MRRTTVLLLAAVPMLGGGCGTDVYQRAEALAGEVRAHRDRQAERVARLNAEFNARHATLMRQYEDALDAELRQGRDADAQKISDQLIADLDTHSLRGAFRSAFASAVAEQRRAIAKAEEALASADASYQASYERAALELKRLDRVHELLVDLSVPPDDLTLATQAVRGTVEAYRRVREEAGDDNNGDGGTTGG